MAREKYYAKVKAAAVAYIAMERRVKEQEVEIKRIQEEALRYRSYAEAALQTLTEDFKKLAADTGNCLKLTTVTMNTLSNALEDACQEDTEEVPPAEKRPDNVTIH